MFAPKGSREMHLVVNPSQHTSTWSIEYQSLVQMVRNPSISSCSKNGVHLIVHPPSHLSTEIGTWMGLEITGKMFRKRQNVFSAHFKSRPSISSTENVAPSLPHVPRPVPLPSPPPHAPLFERLQPRLLERSRRLAAPAVRRRSTVARPRWPGRGARGGGGLVSRWVIDCNPDGLQPNSL